MSENSILKARIDSCERRQTVAGILIAIGVAAQQSGSFFDCWTVEYLGVVKILAGLAVLTYSMYRSVVDY